MTVNILVIHYDKFVVFLLQINKIVVFLLINNYFFFKNIVGIHILDNVPEIFFP